MSQLFADCINEIFEIDDKVTLHSCLLVNRLWREVFVSICWREVLNYNTLIACLPNESKEILHENKIIISTQLPSHYYLIMRHFVKFIQIMICLTGFCNYKSFDNLHVIAQEIYWSLYF